MNTSKKSILIVLLLGVALLFGVTQSIAANASQPDKPQPSPTPEVLKNGWYRFTDDQAGYSISYPSDAYLNATSEAGLDYKQARIVFPTSIAGGNQSMLITVYSNSEQLTTKQLIEQKVYLGKSPKKINDSILAKIKVASLDATKIELTPFSPAILISSENKVYFISLPINMMWGNPPSPDAVELFYKIIDTFSLNK